MAPKGKNKKQHQKQQNSGGKESNNSTPWPDLPKHVFNMVEVKFPNLEEKIHFGGVTKSWRTSTRNCKPESKLPWLHLSNHHSENIDKYRQHVARRDFINSKYPPFVWGSWCRVYFRKPKRYPWKHYVGCSNGILVAESEPLFIYNLWNPIHREWYHLPFWDARVPIILAVLSSSVEDRNCTVMVLTGINHPAFAFYKVDRGSGIWNTQEPQWTRQDCTITESHSRGRSGNIMQFTNAIGFKGKFYALSLQGTTAVLEEVDSVFKITGLSATRAIPSVSSNHFREYLLESDGEILLVFLVSRKSSVHIVDHVEVYKLSLARLNWLKLESLGERTVFVGSNCSMSVLASEVGCRKNSIYFRAFRADEWCVYDMESDTISLGCSKFWMEPIVEE
ncbi:hypothetical protein PIB30_053006 [Stylosanthes scabra]|uniref:KIB1-4 beta-propeller domain-containing protein n=1 Tax=Stylosanthes scabra TaxID=79078 RepID=A0ABU6ZH30_9FABA|nr:hypothetical protein [Stylosanthes scabra]